MAEDRMGYDAMMRDALRGVVRRAITQVIESGLPGAHHFYISFKTGFDGVDIDPELAAKYPDEMTIVLEHQYWDLAVEDDAFEVTLKFNRIPKYIRIPFAALTQFHDPSVGFALRFEPAEDAAPAPAAGEDEDAAPAPPGEKVVSLDAFRKKSD